MESKAAIAAKAKYQIAMRDSYRQDIDQLIEKYEPIARAHAMPRAYIDALENCWDVTAKGEEPAWPE